MQLVVSSSLLPLDLTCKVQSIHSDVIFKFSFVLLKELKSLLGYSRWEQVWHAFERHRLQEFPRIVRDLHRYSSFLARNRGENYEAFKFNAPRRLCTRTAWKIFIELFFVQAARDCRLLLGQARSLNPADGYRRLNDLSQTAILSHCFPL